MQPTGLDASKYVYNAHQGTEGITNGTTGISLGRKVTNLAEGQSLSKGHAPENSPSTLLPERSVQEPASANETQLTKRINPGNRSSVSISQPAQLTADRFFDSGSNVCQGSFFLNPFEFPGFELQPLTRVNEAKAALVACLEKAAFFPSELPDHFGHIDEDLEKQIPLQVENSDSLKTEPRPLDKDILVALGLRVDFPDQGEKV
ncbi:hypothetical protein, partial [Endozoicomonas sp. ONNA2]|uniref:hypothetical protein n=1 Tax=Endozoicomonas sp. ONNA2 TaxID=2828741 RepID=UPI00214908CE